MKTFALMFLLVGVFASLCLAQPPDSLWSRTFGGSSYEECYSVQQTSDGGYILGGYTLSFGAGDADFWLVKTDATGDSLWSRTFGGSNGEDCESMQQTSDGGYILGGSTRSFGIGTPTYANFWLVKADENGDSLWSRTFGGTHDDCCYSVYQTSDGGYIMAGLTKSFGVGTPSYANIWLVKTNAAGDSLWSRTFGGSRDDYCKSVHQISDNGYILAGRTYSFGIGTPSYSNFWLLKTNADGDSVWSRAFGGSRNDLCLSTQQTLDGGYIMAGTTWSYGTGTPSFPNLWLVKTDAEGDSLWSRIFGGNVTDHGRAVQETSDGGYIFGGHTYSFGAGDADFWLVKTGPERPYNATVYLNEAGTSPVVRWIAPQTCDHNIYSTTSATAGEPPTGWTLEETLYNVPGGPAEWTDPAGVVPYKRYAVTMSCP